MKIVNRHSNEAISLNGPKLFDYREPRGKAESENVPLMVFYTDETRKGLGTKSVNLGFLAFNFTTCHESNQKYYEMRSELQHVLDNNQSLNIIDEVAMCVFATTPSIKSWAVENLDGFQIITRESVGNYFEPARREELLKV